MLRLSSHVTLHARGDAAFAWHGLTGEAAEMSRDVLALLLAFRTAATPAEVARRRPGGLASREVTSFAEVLRARGYLVGAGEDEVSWALARYAVVSPAAVWWRRDDGGLDVHDRAGVAHRVAREDAAVLSRCDGHRTLAEALRGRDPAPILRLCRADVAALKLLPQPAVPRLPAAAATTMPWPALTDPDAYVAGAPAQGADPHDMRAYHSDVISDPARQFDEIETTLSHLFRHAHPALGGRTFGEALAAGLRARGALAHVGPRAPIAVETGGGIGFFGEAMRAAWGLSAWHTIDLSPALARSQRRFGSAPVRGDARQLPLRDGSVDVLLSNEMVGDLGTEGGVNTGALAFVREAARVLRPGGLVYASEFGAPSDPPRRSDHLDHDEWSIRFDDLARQARACGLVAEVVPVPELVALRGDLPALSTTRASYGALRGLFSERGVVFDKRAWTLEALREACEGRVDLSRVRGLDVRPIGERTMGLVPGEFWALVARRPLG